MNNKKLEKSFCKKMWEFPQKLNATSMMVIIILSFIIVGVTSLLIFNKKETPYIPEYEELTYSEDMNVAITIASSYTYNDNTLNKQNKITAYFGKTKLKDVTYAIKNIEGLFIGVTEDEEVQYLSKYYRTSALSTYTNTSNQFTCLTAGSKQDYDTIYGKVTYDYEVTSTNEITNKLMTFKEEMLTLTSREIDSNYDTELEDSKIFSSHKVEKTVGTEAKMYTIRVNFTVNSKIATKYHLDYQLFGVDSSNEVYDLVGAYNVSSEINSTIYRTASFPSEYALRYLIVKVVFTDTAGNVQTLYQKLDY